MHYLKIYPYLKRLIKPSLYNSLAKKYSEKIIWGGVEDPKFVFVHINKTGGTSLKTSLGLDFIGKNFKHMTAVEIRDLLGQELFSQCFKCTVVRNPFDRVVSQYYHRKKTNQNKLNELNISFNDWVHLVFKEQDPQFLDNYTMFMPQLEWLTDNDGNLLVDFIGRFENLNEDFEKIKRKLNAKAALPHKKKTKHKKYRDYFNKETKDIITDWFKKDLEYFKYIF